jgi:hypothetical protein
MATEKALISVIFMTLPYVWEKVLILVSNHLRYASFLDGLMNNSGLGSKKFD